LTTSALLLMVMAPTYNFGQLHGIHSFHYVAQFMPSTVHATNTNVQITQIINPILRQISIILLLI